MITDTGTDARPDFSPFSTSRRMETSSSAGLGHINNFLHPQAVIVDKSGLEEIWLLKSFRDRAAQLGKTLIELPKDAAQNMMWFTRLDFASLNGNLTDSYLCFSLKDKLTLHSLESSQH